METKSKGKSIQTTKWGTACAQCASAKAKCSRQPTDAPGSKCDRCERLLKTCTDQVHKPRKPRQPRQQKKFSDEASYGGFDSRHASPLVPSSEGSPSTSPAMSLSGSTSHPPSPQPWLLNSSPMPLHSSQASPSEHRNRLLSVPGLYPLYIEQQQGSDDELLQAYREEMMARFPFVLIPSAAKAEDLNIHRPFLMASIRLVASVRNPQYIRGQVGQIMTHFADSIVVRGERNMDLLFGILVLVGWYHYCQIQHSQLNSLLCLTESLIADLGLGQGRKVQDGSDMPSTRSDEQRALLGAWYLRSCVAAQFNQLKPTPFTPYIQQCLGEINRDREHESDELLVLLVRIQHLTNHISPSSPDHVLSSTWKGLESVIQNGPRDLSKDAQVTIALNSAALRLQRYGSTRFNHTPSTIKSWLDSWLTRLAAPNSPAAASISSPLPTAPVFHLVYTIAVLEANSSTPREPDLWSDQFWNTLEEKTLLPRTLISELASLIDGGDMVTTSMASRGGPSSALPDISLLRASTPDIRLSTPPPGNMSSAAVAVSMPPSTCTTGHHSITSMPMSHQQIGIVQHGYPQQAYQVVDDEQLRWMSSQWSTGSTDMDPHQHMGGLVQVPVTEAGGQIDPALWYDPMAGYGGQPGPSSQGSHYGRQG